MALGLNFSAGNRSIAANLQTLADLLNDLTVPLWTATGTASPTTGSAAEKVHLSAPSSTYSAHTAYRIRFDGLVRSTAGTGTFNFGIRDTNVAGTSRWLSGVYPIGAATTNYENSHFIEVANTGGTDITARVLCLTLASGACTMIINAAAASPYIWECIKIGDDSDFPGAIVL